ncbi:YicC/YloC family endoribonuclease [Shimia thalassica]|uniref:YicC/YloC family endoribonuclease n=1 Tax=Shimia thalassica TaxID=1715693 RepID=UPI0026E3237A|nr:YicC/YloC family endoribonuclease [Shimia thalassica]MDO6522109.1 YicC/YloC family endoribonuclease [Shimia thalassica]
MLQSMTGFAVQKGMAQGFTWAMDMRGVNAKGLDLRLRVPDWIEGLEPAMRAILGKAMARGSVSISLRVSRDDEGESLALNSAQLSVVLDAMTEIEAQAMDRGLSLAPSTASDVLGLRGVLDTASVETDTKALREAILADLPDLLDAFLQMRRAEGEALDSVLKDQLNTIADLTDAAAEVLEARRDETAAALRRNLAKVTDNTDDMDEGRIAQELAIIAVKQDITEELDRLRAHIDAARDLLATGSPVGRKLDFLMQEFNREANTLCSKSQNSELTRIGLDLKAVIDQMREQVQNVE